jgi:lipopolysaccharide transport system permease protein
VFIVLQLFLVAGLGLMLAPLQLYFRDVRQFVGLMVTLGFWLTPVFYRQRQVPQAFKPLYDINPMAHMIEAERGILLSGTYPSVGSIGIIALAAVLAFAVGSAVFAAVQHSLPEKL